MFTWTWQWGTLLLLHNLYARDRHCRKIVYWEHAEHVWGKRGGSMLLVAEYSLGILLSQLQRAQSVLLADNKLWDWGNALSIIIVQLRNCNDASIEWKLNILEWTAGWSNKGTSEVTSLSASSRVCEDISPSVWKRNTLLKCKHTIRPDTFTPTLPVSLSVSSQPHFCGRQVRCLEASKEAIQTRNTWAYIMDLALLGIIALQSRDKKSYILRR